MRRRAIGPPVVALNPIESRLPYWLESDPGFYRSLLTFSVQRSPAVIDSFDEIRYPAVDYYHRMPRDHGRIAYAAALQTAQTLRGMDDRIFRGIFPGVDLTDAFLSQLTYWLQNYQIPLLYDALRQRSDGGELLLFDVNLFPDAIRRLHANRPRILGGARLRHVTSFGQADGDRLAKSYRRVADGAPGGARREPGGLLSLIGAPRELQILREFIDIVPAGTPVTIVLKSDKPALRTRVGQFVSERRGTTMASMRAFRQSGLKEKEMESARRDIDSLFNAAGRLDPQDVRSTAYTNLGLLVLLGYQCLSLRNCLEAIHPRLIVGTFEKSTLGCLLCQFRQSYGFQLVNYQHGLIQHSEALRHHRYDRFLVWNNASAQVLIDNGYPAPESATVVGNPAWEGLRVGAATARHRPLEAWKGDGRMLVVLTQPTGAGIPESVALRFYEDMAKLPRQLPDVKLLLKCHERDDRTRLDSLFAEALPSRSVRVVTDAEVPLELALAVGDAAVAQSSTALIDALAAGKPALAYDVGGYFERAAPQTARYVDVARTFRQAMAWFRATLGVDRPADAVPLAAHRDLIPPFDLPFKDRLRPCVRAAFAPAMGNAGGTEGAA